MNWFDFARTPRLVFETEPLNAFDSIEVKLAATFLAEPLEAYCWEQSTVPSRGTFIGPKKPEKAADLTSTILCLDRIRLDI
jgi:hypothetical protein